MGYAVHAHHLCLVTDVWWAGLPEPGEVHATALWPGALSRAGPGPVQDRIYEAFRETLRLAGHWERGGPECALLPRPAARPWRNAAAPSAAPSAAQRANPRMGTGPDCLTLALQDLGRQLTCRHA